VEEARLLRSDVVVIDHAMRGIGVLEAARRIRAADGAARVIVLTTDIAEESLLRVPTVGGTGFVRKARCHRDLLPAIHAVTDRFPDVPSLRQAGLKGRTGSVNIPASLAERIQEVV
jgi:DNA-binding NarL/FixJ family response regulator